LIFTQILWLLYPLTILHVEICGSSFSFPLLLSVTAYSTHSQLPRYLEPAPPSAGSGLHNLMKSDPLKEINLCVYVQSVLDYGLGNRGNVFPFTAGLREFSLLQNTRTGSGAYPMDSEGLFLSGGKTSGTQT
jgi:hypothetical protein